MKLADGVTVHIGGRVFKGEMPDNMLPKDPGAKKKMVDKQAKMIKAQKKAVEPDATETRAD